MTRSPLFAAALILATSLTFTFPALAADTEVIFDKTLSVAGAPTVNVSTSAGHIHITSGTDTQVHVVGHVRANSGWFSSDSGSRVKQIAANPPIVQSGNTITIGAQHMDSELFHNVSIEYDVTIPRSTTLTAHTGSGAVEITGIQGIVSASSGSGSLYLSLAGSNQATAHTGSGAIHIEGLAGGLNASTGSGSIDIAGNPVTEWRVSTGSGHIYLNFGNNAYFTLNASTGAGSVHVDQPITMQGSLNPHHVSGTVNGGGPEVHASTGTGSIVIN
jgi:DUF4097 and DUF4098 domain-containing protein YvlB